MSDGGLNYICIPKILVESLYKKDRTYYPQVFLKECKYINHLQFSNFSTDSTVILKEKMLTEKSTQPFSNLYQSNLRKSNTRRLKSMNKIQFN